MSDAQLLAILLRVGREGKSAVDLGRQLLERFGLVTMSKEGTMNDYELSRLLLEDSAYDLIRRSGKPVAIREVAEGLGCEWPCDPMARVLGQILQQSPRFFQVVEKWELTVWHIDSRRPILGVVDEVLRMNGRPMRVVDMEADVAHIKGTSEHLRGLVDYSSRAGRYKVTRTEMEMCAFSCWLVGAAQKFGDELYVDWFTSVVGPVSKSSLFRRIDEADLMGNSDVCFVFGGLCVPHAAAKRLTGLWLSEPDKIVAAIPHMELTSIRCRLSPRIENDLAFQIDEWRRQPVKTSLNEWLIERQDELIESVKDYTWRFSPDDFGATLFAIANACFNNSPDTYQTADRCWTISPGAFLSDERFDAVIRTVVAEPVEYSTEALATQLIHAQPPDSIWFKGLCKVLEDQLKTRPEILSLGDGICAVNPIHWLGPDAIDKIDEYLEKHGGWYTSAELLRLVLSVPVENEIWIAASCAEIDRRLHNRQGLYCEEGKWSVSSPVHAPPFTEDHLIAKKESPKLRPPSKSSGDVRHMSPSKGVQPPASSPTPTDPRPIGVPAREVSISVTRDMLARDMVPVILGLRGMMDFYAVIDRLVLLTYGGYEIQAHWDKGKNEVAGLELGEWFAENDIQPGMVIYIRSPRSRESSEFRLFTEYESRSPVGEKGTDLSSRLYLRHWTYRVLRDAGRIMHYRVIAQGVSCRTGKPIEEASVDACLSINTHLFDRFARGLWGLKEWANSETSLDQRSLSIAVAEDDLVYQQLRKSGEPLTTRQIYQGIADYFAVHVDRILEINPIDRKDSRIDRLGDGRWALAEVNVIPLPTTKAPLYSLLGRRFPKLSITTDLVGFEMQSIQRVAREIICALNVP